MKSTSSLIQGGALGPRCQPPAAWWVHWAPGSWRPPLAAAAAAVLLAAGRAGALSRVCCWLTWRGLPSHPHESLHTPPLPAPLLCTHTHAHPCVTQQGISNTRKLEFSTGFRVTSPFVINFDFILEGLEGWNEGRPAGPYKTRWQKTPIFWRGKLFPFCAIARSWPDSSNLSHWSKSEKRPGCVGTAGPARGVKTFFHPRGCFFLFGLNPRPFQAA